MQYAKRASIIYICCSNSVTHFNTKTCLEINLRKSYGKNASHDSTKNSHYNSSKTKQTKICDILSRDVVNSCLCAVPTFEKGIQVRFVDTGMEYTALINDKYYQIQYDPRCNTEYCNLE